MMGTDLDFTYGELKTAVHNASGKKEKWILKQLARGLRPVEIEQLKRYDVSSREISKIFREEMGDDVAPHQCRHALFHHIAEGETTEGDAEMMLDYETAR